MIIRPTPKPSRYAAVINAYRFTRAEAENCPYPLVPDGYDTTPHCLFQTWRRMMRDNELTGGPNAPYIRLTDGDWILENNKGEVFAMSADRFRSIFEAPKT